MTDIELRGKTGSDWFKAHDVFRVKDLNTNLYMDKYFTSVDEVFAELEGITGIKKEKFGLMVYAVTQPSTAIPAYLKEGKVEFLDYQIELPRKENLN